MRTGQGAGVAGIWVWPCQSAPAPPGLVGDGGEAPPCHLWVPLDTAANGLLDAPYLPFPSSSAGDIFTVGIKGMILSSYKVGM